MKVYRWIITLALWPLSYWSAVEVHKALAGSALEAWLGGVCIITFLGAVAATIFQAVQLFEAIE